MTVTTENGTIKKIEEPIKLAFISGAELAEKEMQTPVLQTLVIALGAGLGIWGAINLMEGYGNDNPGANAHGW